MVTHHFQRLFFVCTSLVALTIVTSCNPDEDVTDTPGGSGNTATLSTLPVSNITGSTAVTGGNITSDGGEAVTQRGVVWSTTPNPTLANNTTNDGSGVGSFTSSLTGLSANTTYYVRAYAINNAGTAYGNEVSFMTAANSDETSEWLNPNLTYGSVTDLDGNTYATIEIGTQEWMAENLRTTTYANGDPIPNVTDSAQWSNLTTGAWAHYSDDTQYEIPYGKLYNWYTAADPRNVCPTGWHVPTDAEWTVLTDYLGGLEVSGGKMKTTGTIEAATGLWYSPNAGATNSSGFSGAPGGGRGYYSGGYASIGYYGLWWSSSEFGTDFAWYRSLDCYVGGAISYSFNKRVGFSVRCLRD
jgi:uncharacterized protein (TIGR02145 family)